MNESEVKDDLKRLIGLLDAAHGNIQVSMMIKIARKGIPPIMNEIRRLSEETPINQGDMDIAVTGVVCSLLELYVRLIGSSSPKMDALNMASNVIVNLGMRDNNLTADFNIEEPEPCPSPRKD